jgi:hypothetical protein
MVSWLVFDLDHDDVLIWENVDLPSPNLIVYDRNSGKSHYFYAIVPVCTSEKARSKPIQYLKSVRRAYCTKLNADPAYSGPVAKTPGHPWWCTIENHSHVYDLNELADYVDLDPPEFGARPDIDSVSHSRHCVLFERLRFYAYAIVNDFKSSNRRFSDFSRALTVRAVELNRFEDMGFDANLTHSQVKATVKSVSRWTWDRYTGDARCERGAMALPGTIPLNEKQSLAGKFAAEQKKKKTINKIISAVKVLINSTNKELTYVAVAKQACLTRQTVAKYGFVIKELVASSHSNTVSITKLFQDAANKIDSVNFGTHQISSRICFTELSTTANSNVSLLKIVNKKPP